MLINSARAGRDIRRCRVRKVNGIMVLEEYWSFSSSKRIDFERCLGMMEC